MAKIGQFVNAAVSFREMDGRSKVRPVLVLGKTRAPNGDVVYIAAPRYSAVDKVRGDVEVVMSEPDSQLVGLTKSAVVRFSRDSLVAFLEKDIQNEWGHYSALPARVRNSLESAAKSVRFPLK